MDINTIAALTQGATGMIQKAGTQHAMAGEALAEYTAITQTGSKRVKREELRSTEMAPKERAERQKREAQSAFKSWIGKHLPSAVAGMRKAFTGLFALGGPEALSAQRQFAQAMKQLDQVVGALKDETTTSFTVEDTNDVQIRQAKAHYIKAGSGVYVDGGPTVVLNAVTQVLRAHGFYIEADAIGVVADSEVHRLASSYALDAERMALYLRKVARVEAGEEVELVTPHGSVQIGPTKMTLSKGTSSITLGAAGIDIMAPTINLIGVIGTPTPGPVISSLAVPVNGFPLEDLMDPENLPGVDIVAGAITRAQLESDPVRPQTPKKAQTPLPQWKGRLPQPWAR